MRVNHMEPFGLLNHVMSCVILLGISLVLFMCYGILDNTVCHNTIPAWWERLTCLPRDLGTVTLCIYIILLLQIESVKTHPHHECIVLELLFKAAVCNNKLNSLTAYKFVYIMLV